MSPELILTTLVLAGNILWYLSAWRSRSDSLARIVPGLEKRLALVEVDRNLLQRLQETVNDIKARLEVVAKGGHETNNRMAALPEALSTLFLRKDVADVIIRESAEDRVRIHRQLDDLTQAVQRTIRLREKERE